MDPVTLGILASVVTILAFLYMLLFGQRGIVDWLERRKQNTGSSRSSDTGIVAPVSRRGTPPTTANVLPTSPDPPETPTPREEEPVLTSSTMRLSHSVVMPRMPEPVTMDTTTQELIRSIAQEIQAKNCVFFLGAGVSIEAGLPAGAELADMLARKMGRPYSNEPLPTVAEYYSRAVGPVKPVIHDYLKERLADPTVTPTYAHRALALMSERVDNILTTNWDDLLEKAFDAAKAGRNYQRFYRDAHIRTREQEKTSIVKLHGHVDDPDSYVVTEEDYRAFRQHNPGLANHLRACLTTCTLVIVGYGQEDRDFQEVYEEVLKEFRPDQERRHVYVVNPREDIAWEQYWRDKAQQRFIRLSATDFILEVHRQVKEIADRSQQLEIGRDLILCPRGKPVLEFTGLPGIGKTTLLAAIRREYERQGIHTAIISFEERPDLREDNEAVRRLILNEILQQLGIQARHEKAPEWRTQLKRKRQVGLFFDALEKAPKATVCWLGDTFVPMMEEAPMLRVVFACRFSRLLVEWPLRLKPKVDSQRLSPFKLLADIKRQMKPEFFWDEELIRRIFDLTMGHPGLVQSAMEWLRTRKCWELGTLNDAAQAELSQYVDGLLDTYIMADVPDHLKSVIRQLAYYRGFSLEHVSSTLNKTLFRADTWIRQELKPTGLLTSEIKSHPYAIDQTARELIQNVALTRDTAVFKDTHAAIADRLASQLALPTGSWPMGVAEYIYHLSRELQAARRMGQAVDVELLPARLYERLAPIADEGSILGLMNLLEADVELGILVEDLRPGLYQILQQAVGQKARELEGRIA